MIDHLKSVALGGAFVLGVAAIGVYAPWVFMGAIMLASFWLLGWGIRETFFDN